jgi:superfamily II DNA or RNA helicase
MTTMGTSVPSVGQTVVVRSRAFVVTNKVAQDSAGYLAGAQPVSNLLQLSSVEDDSLGEELSVVWELEPGATVLENSSLPEPNGFDDPKLLDAFMHAVKWGAVSQADQKALQSPFRSGIEIEEYQLDPVVRALTMPRVSLLVADDVGLGKTIETGLVIQEMILRHRVRTVLVVCPSSLQVQWQEEMRDKFGLEFRIIDGKSIGELRRKRGIHVNPWSHFPRLITSVDFLKRERTLRTLKELLPGGSAPSYPRAFDLLVVDEAHNIAPSGTGHYAKESQRTQAVRTLTPHFEHKLFLSATPHNGYRESFSALLELLDEQRFARAVTPDRKQLEAVMVRRLKSELAKRWDGSNRFAERLIEHLEVPYTAAERQAHADLTAYTRLRVERSRDNSERVAAEFVLKLLKKRLFSSPAAFQKTLSKHKVSVGKGAFKASPTALLNQFGDLDDDFGDDEAYDRATDETLTLASGALGALSAEEQELLNALGAYADRSASGTDSKAKALLGWIESHLRSGGSWTDERVIIFTEYRDTQKWLFELLAHAGLTRDERVLQI